MGKWSFIIILVLITTLGIALLNTNNPYFYGQNGIFEGGNPVEKVIKKTDFDLEDALKLE